jgi:hypothetical protein
MTTINQSQLINNIPIPVAYNTGNTNNTGNTGNTNNTGNTGNTGNTSNTGNTNNTSNTSNISNMVKMIDDITNASNVSIIYRNRGWFVKSKNIIKYLVNNESKGSSPLHQSPVGLSRCLQCYEMIDYKNIMYSRILSGNLISNGGSNGGSSGGNQYNNQMIIGNVICLCKNCCDVEKTDNHMPKIAPKTYSDILADYILNERFDLITNDIEKVGNKKIDIIEDRINYMKFNMNEKKVILNNLVNQNNKLTQNLDLEVEKFELLNKQYSQNKELCNNIKNQLLQFSIDIFKENKKQIDEQINKYAEINNATKYSIPECKICMAREIKVAIMCGHVFCMECYNQLLKHNIATRENNMITDTENFVPTIICPTCRTESNTYTQLYF